MADDDQTPSEALNRRNFLGKASATGAASLFGTAAITRAEARQAAEQVDVLTGFERWYQIQRARWNDEVRDFIDQFDEEGKEPAFGEATAYRSVDEENGTEYHSVVIPMKPTTTAPSLSLFEGSVGTTANPTSTAGRTNSMIVWTDNDELETVGHDFDHLGEKRWQNRVHSKENGQITVEEGVIDFDEAAQSAAAQQSGITAAQAQAQVEALGCPDLDWQCIMGMASSFGFMFFNCGKCVASGFADLGGCFICVMNIIGAGAAICDPCPAEEGWPFNPDDGPGGGDEGVQTFKIGHEVVATEAVNVRTNAEVGDNVTFTQPSGTVGWVKNGYSTADGFTWWRVEWENDKTGWSPESKLNRN
jgi:hypothetical protein